MFSVLCVSSYLRVHVRVSRVDSCLVLHLTLLDLVPCGEVAGVWSAQAGEEEEEGGGGGT